MYVKYILAACFSIFILTNCNSKKETASKKLNIYENSTIVCFGDSLTKGYGAADYSQSYPKVLEKYVTIPVINSGVNGDTTADGLRRIKNDVLDYNPVIVIMEFGGNDVYYNVEINEIENNFRRMIDLIKNENTKIFIVRFSDYSPELSIIYNIFDLMLKKLEKEYDDVEIIYDIWEIGMGRRIWGNKEMIYDATHPNSKGYEVMANNILKALKPILRYNNLLR